MKATIKPFPVGCLLTLCLVAVVQVSGQSLGKCNSVFSSATKKKFCDATKYQTIPGADMDKMLDCVLKAVKVVDQTGMGEYQALYDPMNKIRRDPKHDYILEMCIGGSHNLDPPTKRAHEFYKCMMESDSKEAFKKVINQKIC
ncbi:uncharacterized protein LOC131210934 [Anopheles bellator]|uniref:uncharacterized protein LOC131210934 n=1 Tax=Anopheles bellator TaxID=139047 RepID=UPI002647776F|nr:uncharacterized protein LOC131210934 [Anopheles bellator]